MKFIFADQDGHIIDPRTPFCSLGELREHLIEEVLLDDDDIEAGYFYEISGRYQYEPPKKKYSFKKLKD